MFNNATIAIKSNLSFLDVTNDTVVCDKFRVATLTMMNAENNVAVSLNKENIKTFVAAKKKNINGVIE